MLALKGRMLPRPDSPLAQAPKALSIIASLSWGASTPLEWYVGLPQAIPYDSTFVLVQKRPPLPVFRAH